MNPGKPKQTLALGLGLLLTGLGAPVLFGDETPVQKSPNPAGRSGTPRSERTQGRQSPGGGNHSSGENDQSGRGRTYTPSVNKTPAGGGNTGGTYTPPQRNHDPNANPADGNQGGSRRYGRPGGSQTNPTGNNPGGYNPGAADPNRNQNRNPSGGYNPANRNSNPGGYNNGGNRNNNPGGYNNPNRNANAGGYNDGGFGNRNSRGNNAGGRAWRPPQGAASSAQQSGGTVYKHGDSQYRTDYSGRLTHYSRPGTEARFGNNGRVSYAQFSRPDRSTVIVNRGPRGERTVVTVRADRTRVVSYGPRYGYLERPIVARPGYISRTYVYGGRPYVHVYHTYGWRGVTYYRYVPAVYYHPGFYGWVFNPWVTPIYFRWGWYRDPWYGYWGGYFAPAPVYPTAALWLTDYLLAENLRLAYESRQAAMQQDPLPPDYPQGGAAQLTPEIKAAIAEEVRRQIDAERNAAQSGPAGYPETSSTSGEIAPPALDPQQRIFVVSSSLDVTTAAGEGCALTAGDIILRTGDQMTADGRIGVSVLSSKPGDCPVNATADLEVVALQEMHNQFREQIGAGLKTLAENQGKGGLPHGPAPNPRAVAAGQAQADAADSVQDALARQLVDANQAEQEVQRAANTGQ